MKLDVYVQHRLAGTLDQTGIGRFVFTYLPDTPRELAVSLLMPVRPESWISPILHPVFQVSLPEGALRQIIERIFAKKFERFGDMELLAVSGENLVGQVQVVPHGETPANRSTGDTLVHLLSVDVKVLVDHYLGESAHESGVSGGLPKFLARSPIEAEGGRATLPLDKWIVKLNDPDHPYIVLLEHFGQMAAREMGLPSAETQLAGDYSRLLVKRFDVDETGTQLGFEDMCALLALPSRDKFSGSVERIVKTIRAYCPGISGQRNVDLFYGQYLLAAAIRNGDAHLKNFGLVYYPGRTPKLAPVYDMLTMAVYAPRDETGEAQDGMALTLGGTKRWPAQREFDLLAQACNIGAARRRHWLHLLGKALLSTADQVIEFQRQHPGHGFIAQGARMLELWSLGVRPLDSECADLLLQKSAALYADGQSGPDASPPVARRRRRRTIMGGL
ncbi:type II toxin-antitoxin system HipA family toxin [Achromobacter aloeverae]|uniref:Type II toxin-antitoxin system HipA family toxin n=1 Tax=Achromobacter aloeverae TaxID=1750518 RepID=A0A4Q1HN91_9BURK|nr:type II toxin-antitoxin system HipA family toxin [Achromobacter aloeverae]RXN92247.1 hypothetical protein C7R54_00305 [Achromobacter aloeverae]